MSSTDMDAVLDVVDEALDDEARSVRTVEPAGAEAAAAPAGTHLLEDMLDMDEAAGRADPVDSEPVAARRAELELRILSGMHAGARAPMRGDSYLLGALDDCDFVLEDAGVQPHHARLSYSMAGGEHGDEQGWQLDWVAQEGEEPVLASMWLARGKAVPLGPIVVAVDEPHAPWPTLEQLVLVPHAPALEPSLPAPHTSAPLQDAGAGWRTRLRAVSLRRVAVAAVAATLGLSAAAALVVWPMRLDGGVWDGPATAAGHEAAHAGNPAEAKAPDAAQRQAIESVLASRNLTGRARIEPAGALWRVHAPVMSDVDGEVLGAALSRLQPRPLLRLPTELELRDEVAEALPRLMGEHAARVKLRPMGPGRFKLEGRVDRAEERDKLLRTVAEAFPQAAWDNAVLTSEEAANDLLAELRSRGWQAGGEWKDQLLQIQVTLHQRDVPNWEQTLLAVNRTHAVPLRATMAFAQSAPTPSPAPRGVEARLPFQLRGVVGGDMPYVLLSDGDKLSQGGVWKGWRLASISAGQVVFENGAQRAVLSR